MRQTRLSGSEGGVRFIPHPDSIRNENRYSLWARPCSMAKIR